jgi:hypothetical protein
VHIKEFLLVFSTILLTASLLEPRVKALAAPVRSSNFTLALSTEAVLTPPAPVLVEFGGPPVAASVDFQRVFAEIYRVCFYLTFVDDLLDPGDWITFTGPITIGMKNVSAEPQGERTICTDQSVDTAYFLDGKEELGLVSESGSMKISSLQVEVTVPPDYMNFLPLITR